MWTLISNRKVSTKTDQFQSVLKKPLERCRKIAGINKHLTSHCLRKTANDLLRRASGETVARAMIGHTTSEMTRLYSNVDHEEKGRAHAAAFKDVLDVAPVGVFSGSRPLPPENDKLTTLRPRKTRRYRRVGW